ncbi:MAG: cytochrome P450 [Bacteroidia bacterium]|nr:cytochrome P450 [Bacteroidia bacterium]
MSFQIPAVPRREFFKSQISIISDILKTFSSYQKRFGDTFMVNVAGRSVCITTNDKYVAHILVKNNRNYLKDRPTRIVGEFIGNGILTSELPYWLRQRRLIQPAFHKAQIENLSQIMIDETEIFLADMAKETGTTELHHAMIELTLNVVSRSLFSTGVTQENLEAIYESVDALMHLAVAKIRNPLQVLSYKLTGKIKEYDAHKRRMEKVVEDLIEERKKIGPQNRDLLDMLLTSKDAETGESLNDLQLREESLVLFLAGHETSANALTFTLYLLDKHPEVQAKAREEADKVMKDGKLKFEDLRNLPYITKVIKESLRLYPTAWVIGRDAKEDDNIEGLEVKAGQGITIFIYGLHRNPEYWERPDEFDPERFSPEKEKERPTYAYIPFGGGPRLCIGHQFAMTEMQIALAMILHKFNFKREGSGEVKYSPSITLRPDEQIMVSFSERSI